MYTHTHTCIVLYYKEGKKKRIRENRYTCDGIENNDVTQIYKFTCVIRFSSSSSVSFSSFFDYYSFLLVIWSTFRRRMRCFGKFDVGPYPKLTLDKKEKCSSRPLITRRGFNIFLHLFTLLQSVFTFFTIQPHKQNDFFVLLDSAEERLRRI